jgi:hypothetical protein
MGAQYTYRCYACGYEVSTSGPWEFYRDEQGRRKSYGHPVPCSEEAAQRGVYGLSGLFYCPACDGVFDLVLVEFKQPVKEGSVWLGAGEPKDEYRKPGAVKCPKCAGTDLLLGAEQGRVVPCPRCKRGRLAAKMDWIS